MDFWISQGFSGNLSIPRKGVKVFGLPGPNLQKPKENDRFFSKIKNQGKSWNFPILQSKQKIQGERSMLSKIKTAKEKIEFAHKSRKSIFLIVFFG